MSDQPIIVSQSFIKALDPQKENCPRKARAIYIEGLISEPSDVMKLGNFFETIAYGASEDGMRTTAEMDSRKGTMKVNYERVQTHAIRFLDTDEKNPDSYRVRYQMDLHAPRQHIYVTIKGEPGFILRARIDVITSLYDSIWFPNAKHAKVILDTKITGSTLSTFGPFAWGAPDTMDHLQADYYSLVHELGRGERIPFYYLVMDTTPQKRHMPFYKEVTDENRKKVIARIRDTIALIKDYDRACGTEWPIKPSAEQCTRCPLANACPGYAAGITIKRITTR